MDAIEQARIADEIEADAYCDMFASAPVDLIRGASLRTCKVHDATLLLSKGIPGTEFARAIGLGNYDNASDDQIDAVISEYRNSGVTSFWIHLNPVLAPRDLATRLESRGFSLAKRRSWAKMIRDTANPPQFQTTLTVREAQIEERDATARAIANAFGMPPPFAAWIKNLTSRANWTTVAAFDTDRPVGGGLMYVRDNLAWLGLGGVIPEARGRNAHRALMALRIAIAEARGCTHAITETGEPIGEEANPSLNNMYRCGFTRACSRLNYASPSP